MGKVLIDRHNTFYEDSPPVVTRKGKSAAARTVREALAADFPCPRCRYDALDAGDLRLHLDQHGANDAERLRLDAEIREARATMSDHYRTPPLLLLPRTGRFRAFLRRLFGGDAHRT